jgi:tetraacyldisaccharide 4'-kinase
MESLRIVLYPLSFLYGLITRIRNMLFDMKILSSKKMPPWVISLGNLSTGGTGKTPHIEYIAKLLNEKAKENDNLKITLPNTAMLSRGYGRITKGFLLAHGISSATEVGDEPLQLRRRMTDIMVAVDEKRVRGIRLLLGLNQQIKVVLLDDAFQHRYIRPTISILLTNFLTPFYTDHLLPYGNLRESKNGYKRADIIIVTSSPYNLSDAEKKLIVKNINPLPNQKVFFSSVIYGEPAAVFKIGLTTPALDKDLSVILLTGIANPAAFNNYLSGKVKEVIPVRFKDHNDFSQGDIAKVLAAFRKIDNPKKVIITTEKDYVRLDNINIKQEFGGTPLFYIPIHVRVQEEKEFEDELIKYLSNTSQYTPSQKTEVKLHKLA